MSLIIEELSNANFQRVLSTNYSTNGYPTIAPTITNPGGDGVIEFGNGGSIAPRWMHLVPYGVGNNNTTFIMQLMLWRSTGLNVGTPLWVPVGTLGEWTCTLGASVGVASSDLGTTTRFCDTITMTGGPTLITNAAAPTALTAAPVIEKWFQISPVADQIAFINVPSMGYRYVQPIFSTGGSATSCNALWVKI